MKQGGKFFRGRLEGVNAARCLTVVDAALKTAEAIVLHQQFDGNGQRLACGQMFTPEVGKVIMALMVMSCCGSLLGWQFTIAQVFKSSSDEGYFPKIFSRVTKVDAPVQGMLTIVIIQSGLALMTISPSLNSQFNVLVNLAVVTNIIPYILSMAALVIIQKVANVPPSKAKVANFVAFVGAMYSFYALYSSGEEAMLYGSIVTFLGWTLYGLVSPRFELKKQN